MRELKFRAWVGTDYAEDGNTSIDFKMTPPFTIFDIEEHGVLLFDKPGLDYVDLQLHDHVLMQYTGLKDKNGVEIYEGDVVRTKGTTINGIPWEKVGVVRFNPWYGYGLVKSGLLSEVIGNIYETPELVKHD